MQLKLGSMSRSTLWALVPLSGLLLAGVAYAGVSPREATPPGDAPARQEMTARVDAALRKAFDSLARTEPNPHLLMFLDVFHRRFGQERFRDARARYDDLLERTHPDDQPFLLALRRVLGPYDSKEPKDLDPCVPGVDVLACPALHCDRLAAPPDYAERLKEAVADERYGVTHVGLAMMAARDLGCRSLVPEEIEAAAIEGMTKLVAVDGRVTDLEVEAATHLSYLGHGDRLPNGFTEEVLASQRPNGGWAFDSTVRGQRAFWHATCYAAWYLLESRAGPGVRPPMVARD